MKILGRPRTWYAVAAVWAVIVDVMVLVHGATDAYVLAGGMLALPVVMAVVAAVMLRPAPGWVGVAVYVIIAVLTFPVGVFLGPGILAMVLGTFLIGAEPARE